jgi:hypothetical protein
MTWTWTEIISRALVRSGILGRGQIASADMYTEGRQELDLLLDQWDGDGLALPSFDGEIAFSTVANQAEYALGPGGGADYAIRPETIISGTVNTSASGTATWVTMSPMTYPQYRQIPVPSTSGQPWNYAINETWPQMGLFLYPTPVAVYPVRFTCKIKWIDTLGGDPSLNPFAVAEVPSGYVSALVDNLALQLAQKYRLDTSTLENKARNGKAMIALAVATQASRNLNKKPIGLFSWNILTAGRNP